MGDLGVVRVMGLARNHVQYIDTDGSSKREESFEAVPILPQVNLAIVSNVCHGELPSFSCGWIGVHYTAFAISFQ